MRLVIQNAVIREALPRGGWTRGTRSCVTNANAFGGGSGGSSWSSANASSGAPLSPSPSSSSSTASWVGIPWIGSVLRFAGLSAAVTVSLMCCAMLSWPVFDMFLLPYCYRTAVVRSCAFYAEQARERRRGWSSPSCLHVQAVCERLDATARFGSVNVSDDTTGIVLVLSGAAGAGKTKLVRDLLCDSGRECVLINCRGYVDAGEILYGTLTTVLQPLGALGSLVIAYHKLFNAVVDILTMNQQHSHVSHILFAETLQHFRAGLAQRKAERQAADDSSGNGSSATVSHESSKSTSSRRPLVIVDHFEELMETLHRHNVPGDQVSTMPLLLTKILLRSAVDEGLCDVVFVTDAAALRQAARPSPPTTTTSTASSSPSLASSPSTMQTTAPTLLHLFPSLVQRAQFVAMAPLHGESRCSHCSNRRSSSSSSTSSWKGNVAHALRDVGFNHFFCVSVFERPSRWVRFFRCVLRCG